MMITSLSIVNFYDTLCGMVCMCCSFHRSYIIISASQSRPLEEWEKKARKRKFLMMPKEKKNLSGSGYNGSSIMMSNLVVVADKVGGIFSFPSSTWTFGFFFFFFFFLALFKSSWDCITEGHISKPKGEGGEDDGDAEKRIKFRLCWASHIEQLLLSSLLTFSPTGVVK